MNRIGLIADTHGLLRPEAAKALEGSDLILHAGDIGKPEVLELLREIAPVVAVKGNTDRGKWASQLPPSEAVEVGEVRIYVIHNIDEIDIDPVAAGFRAILSGHSHQPSMDVRKGVFFINPGSAGPRRFSLPVSVALLHIQRRLLAIKFIELEVE